ncbi:histidine phosphatase family protein [Salsuginibacillus kocurii]|uniref:histidine phosphatase family protein n=1 Tax=Salsuginibacillus kocurii TaxID=427078 RepID=UPI00035F0BC8|nr:histidine phosphatase family protein [Salsuginibacillus kocurii]
MDDVEGEMTLRKQQYLGMWLTPEQLALYHAAQAERFEQLKAASINNPALYYYFGDHQFINQALAARYKRMSKIAVETKRKKLAQTSRNRSLLNGLREGGYILYARHAEATVGADQPELDFDDCATQRNLSDEGRRQAETYGAALRSLGVPVAHPVTASPFCRAIETAELAFGEENVEVEEEWVEVYDLFAAATEEEQAQLINDLMPLFEVQPPAGENQVIIAHSFPPDVGFGEIPDMGTVVVEPYGEGQGFEAVAYLTLEDWMNLNS